MINIINCNYKIKQFNNIANCIKVVIRKIYYLIF